MKRFWFDIDGVLANIMPVWLTLYNYDWDDNLQVNDITEWNIHQFVKPVCGHKIYNYLDYPTFYNTVMPYMGAAKIVREMRGIMPIGFVTTITKGSRGKKLRWLQAHDMFTPEDMYIETNNPSEKHELEGDYLLDDYFENLIGFQGKGLLMNRYWNESVEYYPRVYTYMGVLDMVAGDRIFSHA